MTRNTFKWVFDEILIVFPVSLNPLSYRVKRVKRVKQCNFKKCAEKSLLLRELQYKNCFNATSFLQKKKFSFTC